MSSVTSLLRGVTPTERTAALVAVLSALDLAHKVVDREGAPAREVKKRAKEIAEGDWAAKAVRDSIAAAQAAVTAAMVATTAATSAADRRPARGCVRQEKSSSAVRLRLSSKK